MLAVLGTRPEAIKLAPVIRELERTAEFEVKTIITGQHRDMVRPILEFFGIPVYLDLNVMKADQDLAHVTSAVLAPILAGLRKMRPDLVLVQGDTTSAFVAALAAHYEKIPVGHVEAGLRTPDRYDPFPEEMNRRLITRLATLHFAPTESNRDNLFKENVDPNSVFVTGNPVIDALKEISERIDPGAQPLPSNRLVVLTTHRRENLGEPQAEIFKAISEIVSANPEIEVVFPVHPNPAVSRVVDVNLIRHERIRRIEPMPYLSFVELLSKSWLILTDSGGIQEEAAALGKPVLVLRRTTERTEIIESGNGKLVVPEQKSIVDAVTQLLRDEAAYEQMATPSFPFGEGGAARRIVEALNQFFDERRSGAQK